VFVAEDNRLTRGALAALLETEPDIRVVGKAAVEPAAVQLAVNMRPDVILVGTDFVVGRVLSVAAELQAGVRQAAILVLADPHKPVILPSGRRTVAPSFLLKDVAPAVLADTVRQVAAGQRVIDQRIALAALVGTESPLTGRELEVLRLAANGASVGEIADKLGLSRGTVRNYLSRAVGRVGARNRIDAIRIAREAGWLD
jgi:two-component system response regulator DesR